MSKGAPGIRYAEVERETKETRVRLVLDLDSGDRRDVSTGIGFLDHMLTEFAFHGILNLGVQVEGDTDIDDHHTVEDVGIAFGKAVRLALVDSEAIVRYASNVTPMDDALVMVAVDVSGRGYLGYDLDFTRENLGGLATENVREFLKAFAANAGVTVHVRKLAGINDHHVCEALFKGLGRALHAATRRADRRGPSSTKVSLE